MQSATLNKTAITFRGKGDKFFPMLAEVRIGGLSELAGFDVMQLDPLPAPLRFNGLLGVIAG